MAWISGRAFMCVAAPLPARPLSQDTPMWDSQNSLRTPQAPARRAGFRGDQMIRIRRMGCGVLPSPVAAFSKLSYRYDYGPVDGFSVGVLNVRADVPGRSVRYGVLRAAVRFPRPRALARQQDGLPPQHPGAAFQTVPRRRLLLRPGCLDRRKLAPCFDYSQDCSRALLRRRAVASLGRRAFGECFIPG
jgi:hypothetical protein